MKRLKKDALKKAQQAIEIIAEHEGKSVEYIRKEMKTAMLFGMLGPDPKVQAMWKNIPCKGDVPEPEELIAWVADSVSKKKQKC